MIADFRALVGDMKILVSIIVTLFREKMLFFHYLDENMVSCPTQSKNL
jgi:hypothetical protein